MRKASILIVLALLSHPAVAQISGSDPFFPDFSDQFGFSGQSPTGTGSTAIFSEIHYKPEALRPWSGE